MAGVLIEKTEERWTITLNAPDRLNALGKTVVSDLLEAARDVGNEKTVRAVILKGSGKGFCAGADLKERNGMTEEEVRSFVSLLNETFNYISQSPKVWISAIHGFCLGGGLELALCTDIRIAHKDTNVGLPEVRRGILPGAGGTQRLPRLIGMAKAKSLILTGRTVKADEGEKGGRGKNLRRKRSKSKTKSKPAQKKKVNQSVLMTTARHYEANHILMWTIESIKRTKSEDDTEGPYQFEIRCNTASYSHNSKTIRARHPHFFKESYYEFCPINEIILSMPFEFVNHLRLDELAILTEIYCLVTLSL